jgi:superfamily II DNA or RNA helicase
MMAPEQGRSPLLLTERTDHVIKLAARLRETVPHVIELKGGMGKRQRELLTEQLYSVPEGEKRVVIATGRYIGEGFDDPRLDTLFLAMPISWRGTLQQYVGRIHRLYQGKREVQVYDYVDHLVPMLSRMYQKRLKGYKDMGYRVESADRLLPC